MGVQGSVFKYFLKSQLCKVVKQGNTLILIDFWLREWWGVIFREAEWCLLET